MTTGDMQKKKILAAMSVASTDPFCSDDVTMTCMTSSSIAVSVVQVKKNQEEGVLSRKEREQGQVKI